MLTVRRGPDPWGFPRSSFCCSIVPIAAAALGGPKTATATATTMPTIEETLDEGLVDLRLDDDNVDDDDREEHPRRLLQVAGVGPGASAASSIVAYGGNFGKVVSVRTRQVVRTTEDAIRAVAVNQSGTRVVLGSDSGDTFIFAYDDDTLEGGAGGEHPFVAMPLSSSSSLKDGEDSEDRFMSQGSEMVVRQGETCWEASRDDDAMRDYAWLNDGTTLLCASEKHWFWLDCSTEASCVTKHFAGELDAAHAGSGIRSVALNENQSALITLDMEGRACWWRPATNNRNNKKGSGGAPEWELLHREATKCVTRKDVGEVFGSSSWCRSSRPHFVTGTVAALPGEPFLQLRRLKLPKGNGNGDGSLEVETFDQVVDEARDGSVQGHVQAIVTMCSRDGYLITAGRDGRVVVWDVQVRLAFPHEPVHWRSTQGDVCLPVFESLLRCAGDEHRSDERVCPGAG
jgi:WD40 repeat protein